MFVPANLLCLYENGLLLEMDCVVYKTDTERRFAEMESTICKGRCENERKAIQITELEACRWRLILRDVEPSASIWTAPAVNGGITLSARLEQLLDEENCRAMEVLKASGSGDAELNYSLVTCFNESKSLKCCAPVLKLPDFQKELVLRTDASDTGLDTMFLQTLDDQLFPVAFASKTLSGPTKVYATVKRECLAFYGELRSLYRIYTGALSFYKHITIDITNRLYISLLPN